MLTRLLGRLRQHLDAREVPRRGQVAFFFVAGGMFVLATMGAFFEAQGLRHGPVTHGVIIERNNGGRVPTVTLRFPVPDRGEVDCITDVFREDARVGETTKVRYDPGDPANTCSTGERGDYGGFIMTAIVATALIGNGERLRRRRAHMRSADAK